jgi:hypothetical protein
MNSQEQVQLNVALQTEIVRFTVLGIQRAIKDVDETMAEQERLSGGGAGTSSFFVSPRAHPLHAYFHPADDVFGSYFCLTARRTAARVTRSPS